MPFLGTIFCVYLSGQANKHKVIVRTGQTVLRALNTEQVTHPTIYSNYNMVIKI